MRRTHRPTRRMVAAAIALTAGLGLVACSGPSGTPTTGGDDLDSAETGSPGNDSGGAADDEPERIGSDCNGIAGELGSDGFDGLAALPTSEALEQFPQLSTLVDAVSGGLNPDVDLTEALDGSELTLFAPIDDAFAELGDETLDTLGSDADALTRVLEYHVVTERLEADQVSGILPTLEGAEIEVNGRGDAFTANNSGVICGGISTANGELYLIEDVLQVP